MKLYKFQRTIVDYAIIQLAWHKRVELPIPTGCGYSHIAVALARKLVENEGRPCIIFVNACLSEQFKRLIKQCRMSSLTRANITITHKVPNKPCMFVALTQTGLYASY